LLVTSQEVIGLKIFYPEIADTLSLYPRQANTKSKYQQQACAYPSSQPAHLPHFITTPAANGKISIMLKLIGAGLLVLVIGVGALVYARNDDSAPPANSGNTVNQSAGSPPPAATSQYIDYYDGVIAATAGEKVLFFHAPWCPQCRALETSIKAGQIPEGVTIIKTDYDSMQQLRQTYGVTIQTTLVKVDDSGNLVKKYVAYDEPTLQAVIDNLL
jgi:hypothetical protein